ncbi:DedA family protein [Sphaerisporangium perillae]|uniref:DedA family protein n=1 Tax=Sphaerisporangium perillae TaxID=2935860 RepID=UPI00200D4377|nr:DedA family protein [Sphaerisporangium perillae]
MSSVIDHILTAPAWLVCLLVGLLVFAEDALFVGFVVPGETAAIVGGIDASRGHVSLALIIAVVVAAAIIGDSVGYEIGHHVGARILHGRFLAGRGRQVSAAQELLARRGGPAVFWARFVAFLRAVMPALAGTAQMPYRRFLAFNAAGGLVWGTGCVLAGYLAGNSYRAVEHIIGRIAALAILAVILLAAAAYRSRSRRSQ